MLACKGIFAIETIKPRTLVRKPDVKPGSPCAAWALALLYHRHSRITDTYIKYISMDFPREKRVFSAHVAVHMMFERAS